MTEPLDAEKISPVTVILHSLLALSIFFLFISSWWMLSLPLPSENFTYRELPFQLHKNIGLTLLVILLLMMSVRFTRRQKIKPAELSFVNHNLMKRLASVDHLVLYFLIFVCCLSGYLSSSFSGWQTSVWWLFNLPVWSGENDELNIFFSDVHTWTCWVLLAVISIHLSAAIFHAFRDDGVINKMFRLD